MISHRILSWVFSQYSNEKLPTSKCRTGYQTEREDARRMIRNDYPSRGFFSLTAILTYLGASTNEFSPTLTAMGQEWSSRSIVSYIFIVILFLMSLIYQHFTCENGPGEMICAFVFGVVIGLLFFYIHKKTFGLEGINFLGLPYLVSKNAQGSPLYVCQNQEK